MATKKKTPKAKSSTADVEMKYHLIGKYREVVEKRYDYKVVNESFELPESINKEVVDELKKYFLESLYPEASQREKLDAAFEELQNYVLHPGRITDLLGNIGSAILRFGFQFPVAIKSGLNALEVHTSAKHFENSLLAGANKNKFTVPLSDEQFYVCLKSIPKPQLQKFINEVSELFHAFSNTDLLGKTISIMDDVLQRMYAKTDVYSANEIEAIELGREIIRRGHDLFLHLDEQTKLDILELVKANENDFLESVYAE